MFSTFQDSERKISLKQTFRAEGYQFQSKFYSICNTGESLYHLLQRKLDYFFLIQNIEDKIRGKKKARLHSLFGIVKDHGRNTKNPPNEDLEFETQTFKV